VTPHHFVERSSQTFTGPPPPPDSIQSENDRAAEPPPVEILVRYRIAPEVQIIEEPHQ
jgi:hypothetical protein